MTGIPDELVTNLLIQHSRNNGDAHCACGLDVSGLVGHARHQATVVLEAVGLPALLERVEAAESLLRAIEDSRLDPARAIIKADRLAGEAIIKADALAAKVADAGEQIGQAIEVMPVDHVESLAGLPVVVEHTRERVRADAAAIARAALTEGAEGA
jgi:hypothetical protein